MADPPPIRRPPTRPPPPIPRAPIAPAPAKTDVVAAQAEPRPDELLEDTKNLEAPDAGLLVHHMLELVASEAEALLAGDGSDGRLADLNVRTAFASWDGLGELSEAIRYLELADRHPLTARLLLAATLLDETALAATRASSATRCCCSSSSPRRGCSAMASPTARRRCATVCSTRI